MYSITTQIFFHLFRILIYRIVNNSYYYHIDIAVFLNIKIQIKVSEEKEKFNNNSIKISFTSWKMLAILMYQDDVAKKMKYRNLYFHELCLKVSPPSMIIQACRDSHCPTQMSENVMR